MGREGKSRQLKKFYSACSIIVVVGNVGITEGLSKDGDSDTFT
jgi:RNA-binding protein YhbY